MVTGTKYRTVKWGKSEHLKNFKVILKLFCDGFLPIFLQKSGTKKIAKKYLKIANISHFEF
jgi:hypothetical protein